jgi:hypothetical protein
LLALRPELLLAPSELLLARAELLLALRLIFEVAIPQSSKGIPRSSKASSFSGQPRRGKLVSIPTEVRSMEPEIQRRCRATAKMVLLTGLFVSSLLVPVCASATLGGDVTSVEADQQQMKAERAVRANGRYTVHEITTPYGTVVREYVSPNGTVFGVAWRGPFLPNFQQLLGSYYDRFVQGAKDAGAGQARRSRNTPLNVNDPELVMHSGGHTRAYVGQAYVPGMIPAGVDAKELR